MRCKPDPLLQSTLPATLPVRRPAASMRCVESARSLCRCESCCRRPPPKGLAKGKGQGQDEVFIACLRGEGSRYAPDGRRCDCGQDAVESRRARLISIAFWRLCCCFERTSAILRWNGLHYTGAEMRCTATSRRLETWRRFGIADKPLSAKNASQDQG